MGNDGSRVIEVQKIEDQLAECQLIQKKSCPVYGNVHYVNYNGMQFFLGESLTQATPHPMSLHYLVPPNLLEICPSSFDILLQIMAGVAQMAVNGGDIGVGYGRVAYAGRWGVVGQQAINWAYQEALQQQEVAEGIFLSPQLMISLSQGKTLPKHSIQKSDVFAFGIILVQMIFQQKLGCMFDYQNYQISLKPLLQKLYMIRQQYGDQVYQMFLGMLEIEQQQRLHFRQLYEVIEEIRRTRPKMINSRMTSSNHSRETQRGARTPTKGQRLGNFNRSPGREQSTYSNNVSPFRARNLQNKKLGEQVGRTPEGNRGRQQNNSRSPLRRDLRINAEFGGEGNFGENVRRPLSPLSRR